MKEDTDVRPMASAAMVMRFRMRSRGAEHTGCSAGGHCRNCSRGTGGVNISVPLYTEPRNPAASSTNAKSSATPRRLRVCCTSARFRQSANSGRKPGVGRASGRECPASATANSSPDAMSGSDSPCFDERAALFGRVRELDRSDTALAESASPALSSARLPGSAGPGFIDAWCRSQNSNSWDTCDPDTAAASGLRDAPVV